MGLSYCKFFFTSFLLKSRIARLKNGESIIFNNNKQTNKAKISLSCERLVFLGFDDVIYDIEKFDRLSCHSLQFLELLSQLQPQGPLPGHLPPVRDPGLVSPGQSHGLQASVVMKTDIDTNTNTNIIR